MSFVKSISYFSKMIQFVIQYEKLIDKKYKMKNIDYNI